MVTVIRYTTEKEKEWNEFAARAKNTHFFFNRSYMDYHKDRFQDFSLMIYNDKNNLIALLPANHSDEGLISHGGLTFGGFIVDRRMTAVLMLDIFQAVLHELKMWEFSYWIYKCIPYIYHQYPSEEDLYALIQNNAKLFIRTISSTIHIPSRYPYQKGRKWMIAKGRKNKIKIRESNDFKSFIDLENFVLAKHHGIQAVHTGSELSMLAKRFPNNIKLYIGERDGEMLAGTVIFENGNTVHTQYMANSDEGRNCGALDTVIDHLLHEVYSDRIYFDFGISCENDGSQLNEGLIAQKEGFGARAIIQDIYKLSL